jgi:hypothetical protein
MQVKKEINQLEWEKRKLENITKIKSRRKKGKDALQEYKNS